MRGEREGWNQREREGEIEGEGEGEEGIDGKGARESAHVHERGR